MPTEIKVFNAETGETYGCNPDRDVAFFMPKLLKDLERRVLKQITDVAWLSRFQISEEEAREAFCRLEACLATAIDPDVGHLLEGSRVSGFDACSARAQDAVLGLFGATCLGACWAGSRSSAIVGSSPLLSMRRRGAEMVAKLYGIELDSVPKVGQTSVRPIDTDENIEQSLPESRELGKLPSD
jgi:hypothetical protein